MATKSKSQEKHKMSEIDDHILKYFDIRKRLGKGAYGIVWKATDKKNNQTVAVKKIFDAFRDETDAQRTFREIMFLRAFHNHPNIIQLHNVYKATNNLDIYLSFEFMESDLHNVIKKGNILKDVHKRYIMYQLLNAIKYIHSGNVIHRDLKPSNVLIDTKCKCKLADFGLARSVSNQQSTSDTCEHMEPALTDYVATRWYRAPEILVASKKYTKGIDMWSLGCILGEMIRGKPIFQGSSTVNQIEKIVSALPEITEKDVQAVGGGFGTALLNKQISNISSSSTATLDDLLVDGTSDASNLVKRLLVLDPLARLTANEALSHKYVEKFRHSIQELELNVDVQPPFRDDVRLSVTEYRSKLYEIALQTEKSNSTGRIPTYSRKREPKPGYKSVDNIVTKSNHTDDRIRRNVYRVQERKSCIPNPSGNTSTASSKITVRNNTNKVHIVIPPTTTIPKTESMLSLSAEQNSTDAKPQSQSTLAKHKYVIKSTIKHTQPPVRTKNTNSSPEISKTHHPPSKLNKYLVDKRHSIDGSYHHETPSSTTDYHRNQLSIKDRHTNVLHNSQGSIHRSSDNKSRIPSSQMRRSSQNLYYTSQRNTTDMTEQKEVLARRQESTKLDDYSEPHDGGGNYYEKRLKRLEEQIEKHKRDIKAFCSENTKYSKSMTFNRNTEQEPKLQYNKDRYSVTSTASGKNLHLRPKVSNGSYKHSSKHGSSHGFEYLYAGGDDINRRQEVTAKYEERKSTFK